MKLEYMIAEGLLRKSLSGELMDNSVIFRNFENNFYIILLNSITITFLRTALNEFRKLNSSNKVTTILNQT